MKKLITVYIATASVLAIGFSSCKKTADSSASSTTAATSSSLATTTGDILIAASTTGSTVAATTKDSVYLMKACPAGKRPDTVAFSALPSAIGTYLTANYSGYTFQKAFKIVNSAGTLTGYVVAINYNGKPVGLKFDASGTFLSVLEQREPADHDGP